MGIGVEEGSLDSQGKEGILEEDSRTARTLVGGSLHNASSRHQLRLEAWSCGCDASRMSRAHLVVG
jgi:hypothetical protein